MIPGRAAGGRAGARGPGAWSRWRPGWAARGRMAALGALVAAGQAPLGLWGLALPALAVLLMLLSSEARPGRAAFLGWYAGAGYFAAALFWIVEPFFVDASRDGWMAPFALPMMAFGMALFWAGAAGFAAALGRGREARLLALAVALAGADLARSYMLTGFPWTLFGHLWIGTPLAQLAAIIGPIGLSLLTLLAGAALAGIAVCRVRATRAALAGFAVLLVAGGWGFGLWRLSLPDPLRDPAIHVRLVQPNATQKLKWLPGMWAHYFDRMLVLSAAPPSDPAAPRPDLIVWPETAVPWLLNRPGDTLSLIAEAAGGATVALGIQRSADLRAFNSLAVLGPDAGLRAVYDKHHLVPFGEYIPLGDLAARFGITAFAAQEGNGYSAGPAPQLLDLGPLGRVLPLICYEAVFPQDLRQAERDSGARADWILQVTNDAWFGNLSGPYQHLAQARLRAIEQGLPLLRAANTGVSAVIDAKGRVLQSLPLNTEGAIDAGLPASLPQTVYARTGDLPAALLLLGLALGLVVRRVRLPIDPGKGRV